MLWHIIYFVLIAHSYRALHSLHKTKYIFQNFVYNHLLHFSFLTSNDCIHCAQSTVQYSTVAPLDRHALFDTLVFFTVYTTYSTIQYQNACAAPSLSSRAGGECAHCGWREQRPNPVRAVSCRANNGCCSTIECVRCTNGRGAEITDSTIQYTKALADTGAVELRTVTPTNATQSVRWAVQAAGGNNGIGERRIRSRATPLYVELFTLEFGFLKISCFRFFVYLTEEVRACISCIGFPSCLKIFSCLFFVFFVCFRVFSTNHYITYMEITI